MLESFKYIFLNLAVLIVTVKIDSCNPDFSILVYCTDYRLPTIQLSYQLLGVLSYRCFFNI